MSRRATQGSWCSGHSPYRCELIKLPSKAKKCYGAGLEFSEKFRQPPHYIVVKHADSRLVRRDGKTDQFHYTVNSPLTDTFVSGQLFLRTLFSIPIFTSQSNSVFTRSRRKRTLSSKRTPRDTSKWKIGLFFCLRSRLCGQPEHKLRLGNDWSLYIGKEAVNHNGLCLQTVIGPSHDVPCLFMGCF